jgi:signal peptidase I
VQRIELTPGGADELPSLHRGRWRGPLQRALQAVWVAVVPAFLAVLVLRYLVPPAGAGLQGIVAELGHRFALYFGVALFFLFSTLTRYWRHHVPGGRYASTLPAHRVPSAAGSALAWRRGREALGLCAMVAAAAATALALRAYVVQPYRVLTGSMLPTLEPDDILAGTKRPYTADALHTPRRGDLVVFQGSAVTLGGGSAVPGVLVKRVVGLPGDRIAMRGGAPVINGWQVPSCDAGEYLYVLADGGAHSLHGRLRVEFLEDRTYLTVHAFGAPAFPDTYVVRPGEVFVLGDNRGNSLDSRAYGGGHGGGVPVDAIEARARWFLIGTQRESGQADMGRLLRPIDMLQARLRLEGVETQPLEEGIARCLANRPSLTGPPAPGTL